MVFLWNFIFQTPLFHGQFNLACFYEEGIGTGIDMEAAKAWYIKAAEQNHDLAIRKCKELKIYTD
ncbi:MAG: SEL1-like repeat protein [Clostridia bacterium]|nr:SEL1-like repeat protein [Clostridia bacterium]